MLDIVEDLEKKVWVLFFGFVASILIMLFILGVMDTHLHNQYKELDRRITVIEERLGIIHER